MTAPIFVLGDTWKCPTGRWWEVEAVGEGGAELALITDGMRRTTRLELDSPTVAHWVRMPPELLPVSWPER